MAATALSIRQGETGARSSPQRFWESSSENPVASCSVSKSPEKLAAASAVCPGQTLRG